MTVAGSMLTDHGECVAALTPEMERAISTALDGGPATQVLVEGFRLQITRADMATLRGLNWLNDEVRVTTSRPPCCVVCGKEITIVHFVYNSPLPGFCLSKSQGDRHTFSYQGSQRSLSEAMSFLA